MSMRKLSTKLKILLWLHRKLGLSQSFICGKCGISRATFYRYKKRLKDGKMIRTKR